MQSTHDNKSLCRYDSNRNVRARLREFMGGRDLDTVTAESITADDSNADVLHQPHSNHELFNFLYCNRDVGRSLWDHQSLIVDLDIGYVNFNQPALPQSWNGKKQCRVCVHAAEENHTARPFAARGAQLREQ